MFGRFSRVRVLLRDSANDPADDTRVLIRQRTGWVMLLAAYLALFCLPAHRAYVSEQAARAIARRAPSWMRAAEGEPGDAREQLRRTARKSPGELDLQLGAVLVRATPQQAATPAGTSVHGGFSDPNVQAAEAIRIRFRNDPVAIANVLRLCWAGAGGLARDDLEGVSNARQLPSKDLARMEELCLEGSRVDPDNGYFHTILAAVQFAGRKDGSALRSLHAASVCGTWQDYALHQGAGARDLLIRTFGDRGLVMHALPSASILLPHFQAIRQSAQLAAAVGRKASADGNLQLEHRTRTDVIRLGSLMRRSADTLIGRLVGAAVEDIGFGAELHQVGLPDAARNSQAASDREAYAARIRTEAPALAAEVEHELNQFERFLEVRQSYLDGSSPFKVWDQMLEKEIQRDVLGLTLLPNLAASLLLWLLSAIAVSALRPRSRRPSGDEPSTIAIYSPLQATGVVVGLGMLAAAASTLGTAMFTPANEDLSVGLLVGASGLAMALAAILPKGATDHLRAWSPASLLLALCLATVAGVAASRSSHLAHCWRSMLPALWLLGDGRSNYSVSLSTQLLCSGALVSLVIPLSVFALAAVSRRTFREAMDGVRLAFKSAAAIAAGLYLVYVLLAVPATARDAQTWEQNIAQSGEPF